MHGAREPAADLQFSWLSSRIADDSGGITGRSNGAIFSRYCGSFDIFFVDWTDEFDRWLTNAEEQGGKLLEVAVALLQALNDLRPSAAVPASSSPSPTATRQPSTSHNSDNALVAGLGLGGA